MNKRGHALNGILLGIGFGYILEPSGDFATVVAIVKVTPPVVLGAMLPDLDTAFGKHRKLMHNLPLLAGFYAFPVLFGNLSWVWLGILSHYVLDVAGSTRGIALFYPYPEEYGLPVGVTTSSKYAQWMMVLVTVGELAVIYAVRFLELPVAGVSGAAETFQFTLLLLV